MVHGCGHPRSRSRLRAPLFALKLFSSQRRVCRKYPSSVGDPFEDGLVTVNPCLSTTRGEVLMGPNQAKHHLHSPPHLASSKHGTDASAIMMKRAQSPVDNDIPYHVYLHPCNLRTKLDTLVVRNRTHRRTVRPPLYLSSALEGAAAARPTRKEATVAHCDLLICNSDSLTEAATANRQSFATVCQ